MEEIKKLALLTFIVVAILITSSLPWLIILVYGFRSLAAEMQQTQFTAGLGNAYVIILISALILSSLILFFLVRWVSKNKKRLFDT
jgi:hypothetical protein